MSSKKDFAEMSKLVTQVMGRGDAEPFRHPVEWKELGLFDYPQIVKNPMDLTTVQKRLQTGHYGHVEEAAADVRLIWKNCQAYNADGSDFYMLASDFAKRFEDKYARLSGDALPKKATPSKPAAVNDVEPTLEEKQIFARGLFRINKEELGKVVTVLDDKSPEALTKNSAEDEVEINVDSIVPRVFHELSDYLDSLIGGAGKKAKA
ncbi:hypothetical protein TeGR_g12756 [Tetraparma gracilis]|uniref:Bromodomain-containing protein n=1 Tax=Tetraparma gracilis TaxID=2962635 RepID=A0ABQ6MVX3_9STRA|nr:hypothetical protein TeGR_g12756 [Tetraparma gracilis]